MNRKIFFSGLSILATLGVVGGATFAQLTSQANADNVTFTSETANLLIATDSGTNTPEGPFLPTYHATAMNSVFPGYSHNFAFWLDNNSGNDIPLNTVVTLSVAGTPSDLMNNLQLSFNCIDQGLDSVTPTPGAPLGPTNGSFALSSYGSENVGTLLPHHFAQCIMNASVPTSVTTLDPADHATINVIFTGTQVEPSISPTPSTTPL